MAKVKRSPRHLGVLAGNTPEQSHASWMSLKASEGWIYGLVKNPEKKEHPCMVEYGQLPLPQQLKDEIYITVVRAVLKAHGAWSEACPPASSQDAVTEGA